MLSRRHFLLSSGGAASASLVSSPGLGKDVNDEEEALFSVGLIADAQYADAEPGGIRHYRRSIEKLATAVEGINRSAVSFTIHLGDLIDRHFASFETILEPLGVLREPVYHILGNHDFSVEASEKSKVPERLGMSARFYAFSQSGIRFVFLDGTEVSTFAHLPDDPRHVRAMAWLAEWKAAGRRNAQPWNGGIGDGQLEWLEGQLAEAGKAGEKAILLCHYPILPDNAHNLWNDTEVLELIDRNRGTVLAWFNGHNHAGNYAERNGVHYVTVHGMVDTPDTNAWAILDVLPGARLRVRGEGREPDRLLE